MPANLDFYFDTQFVTYLKVGELAHLVEMACKTCWTANVDPVAILIRSHMHDTSTSVVGGRKITVPDRWHITISVKDAAQAKRGDHTTYHGYVTWEIGKVITDVNSSGRKPDWTPKGEGKKKAVCWPTDPRALYRVKDRERPDLHRIYREFWTSY